MELDSLPHNWPFDPWKGMFSKVLMLLHMNLMSSLRSKTDEYILPKTDWGDLDRGLIDLLQIDS